MALRRLPLDPNLEQLKNQARDLLADYVAGDAEVTWTGAMGVSDVHRKLYDE